MSAYVGHFEIPADNPARAREFYSSVFGWSMTPLPEMDYTMFNTGPADKDGMPKEPGYIGGGIGMREGPFSAPLVMITVPEISEAERSIEKHGGKIVQKKQPIGDGAMGHTAYFKDSEGNILGLYEAGR